MRNKNQSKDVIDFLHEIKKVCLTYNYAISHEDTEGAFIVNDLKNPKDLEWFLAAVDKTDKEKE